MQKHAISYCCEAMDGYINSGLITVNTDTNKANMTIVNVPNPDDDELQDPEMTRIPINYCPNCGMVIVTYSENIPTPTYTRATLLGGSCNDNTCRYNDISTSTCCFQYINDIGCYITSDAAKQSISDLLANLQIGYIEMTNQK